MASAVRRQTATGSLFVLSAAVLWGTTGTAQAFAPPSAHPVAIGAVRLAIGGLALLLLAASRGGLHTSRTWPRWPIFFAAASIALYQICFFAAVARTGVAVGTVVTIGSAPVLAGLLAWLSVGEQPQGRWWAATLCAITGCVLLVVGGNTVSADPLGITLALGAGASYAVYALASKRLLAGRSPDAVVAVVFCSGALLLTPVLFFADLTWLAQPGGWLVALHLGLLATAAAYALFARGLVLIPVASAVTLTLMEPLTAGVLGVVVLGERLTSWAALGVLLLIGGLALLALQSDL